MRFYEYRHTVGFEETNLVGNVYYANHIRWQGRCREMFLRDHAPGVSQELADGLALVTVRCDCEYFDQLRAFDEVSVRMTLGHMDRHRLGMEFDYWKVGPDGEHLVARGSQEIACLRSNGDGSLVPTPVPDELRVALAPYGG